MFLREALDELQHAAVRHQVQGALSLVVGVADVSPFLREETSDGRADAQLRAPQKTRSAQLWTHAMATGEGDGKDKRKRE